MLGYIIAIVLGAVILGFCIAGLSQMKPGPGASRKPAASKPVQNDSPAADEPTPDRSVTATAGEIRSARQHTPPA